MVLNDSSLQERGSLLNEQPADKAGVCFAGHHDHIELPSNVAPPIELSSCQTTPRISVVGLAHAPTSADQVLSQSSPLSCSPGSFPLSSSGHDQSQLYRRNNRHRQAGYQGGKENIPPYLSCQPGKTHTTKTRRPALADVSNAHRRASETREDISFAGSTSIHSPSRKVGNGEPGAAGLWFELDLAKSDSQETVTQDSFVTIPIESVDRPTECRPESTQPRPSTPLREALASFNDIFSSTFSLPAKKSTTGNDTSRLSFHLPASPLLTGVSISNAFNMSTLADSISQLTGDIAASITARYENDHLQQGQYREDAVARDETFDWEEEMRCLEVQCGKTK